MNNQYTVAFGDLQISVHTNKTNDDKEYCDTPLPCASHSTQLNGKDEQLVRALHKSRIREMNKRTIRDNKFWDNQHINAVDTKPDAVPIVNNIPNVPEKIKRPFSENVKQKGLHTSLVKKDKKEQAPANSTRWIDKLPEAVRCVIDSDVMQEERESSTMIWSDVQGGNDMVRMEDFFMGSYNTHAIEKVLCWHCAVAIDVLHFRQFPFMLPFRYQQGTEYFMVKGYFCCWECVRGYVIDHGLSHLVGMLSSFLYKLYGRLIQVRPFCGRYSLQRFGGTYSYETYMNNTHSCNRERITHLMEWHPNINGCVRIVQRK